MSRAKLLLPACCFAALLCACAGVTPYGQEKPSGPGSAVIFEKQTFKLSKTPDQALEQALEPALTESYQSAVKKHYGEKPMEIGFTYSMTPRGAAYPFSEIEVSCIIQGKYFQKGARLCGEFFKELDLRLKTALAASGE